MSTSSTQFRTPLKKALGLGSARSGARHFLLQRYTALAIALLAVWFLWLVLRMTQLDHAGARALLAQPWHATLMIGFIVAVFWHAQLGLQVVIEDYVQAPGAGLALQIAVKFLCFLGAAAATLAVLLIALGR